MEVLITKSNSFKNFDLVVAALCKAVGNRRRKGIFKMPVIQLIKV